MKVIQLDHINKSYFTNTNEPYHVLKNITFDIDEGEFVAIMGASGSGKSTLMNILGCLDTADSGTYKIAGELASSLSVDKLAYIRGSEIGFVFQGFNLLMKRTLADNVSLPLIYFGVDKQERYKRAKQLLKSVGLEGLEGRYPNEISGGQQQRVAIARALINNPKIILADEPTGNLDTKNSIDVMQLFKGLHREGKTIILITHEPDIASTADRLINLTDGIIRYDGTVENFKHFHAGSSEAQTLGFSKNTEIKDKGIL